MSAMGTSITLMFVGSFIVAIVTVYMAFSQKKVYNDKDMPK